MISYFSKNFLFFFRRRKAIFTSLSSLAHSSEFLASVGVRTHVHFTNLLLNVPSQVLFTCKKKKKKMIECQNNFITCCVRFLHNSDLIWFISFSLNKHLLNASEEKSCLCRTWHKNQFTMTSKCDNRFHSFSFSCAQFRQFRSIYCFCA